MYNPRWYQLEAVDSLFRYFEEHRSLDGVPVKANALIGMPTGTGKSLSIALFNQRALQYFPSTRIVVGTHVKELIEGNARTMLKLNPAANVGVYSSGLKSKDTAQSIIYGGIQSMVKQPELFNPDILHIDEAHLVSPESDTSYLTFIENIQKRKPFLKVIGWTATAYRLGLGSLTNGSIFTDFAFDLTNMESFNRLLREGYLCPVIPQRTETVLDMSGVGMVNGDFNQAQAQAKIDKAEITFAALKEVVAAGQNRASWMIFAAGIEHAEHITKMLRDTFGISAVCVHAGNKEYPMSSAQRDANIDLFKTGQVRCIVNKDILTTGFDHPPIDLIAVLRPTMSTGLWVQMLGRGTRPYDWQTTHDPVLARWFRYFKHNCLVLDFANNTKRLGPINDPVIPKRRGEGPPGDSPIKTCPKCPAYVHASATVCPGCGHIFVTQWIDPNINATASTDELIKTDDFKSDLPVIETFEVQRVIYDTYYSVRSQKRSLKVTYHCGNNKFWEYIAFEAPHKPFAIHKGHDWFRQRCVDRPIPENALQAKVFSPYYRQPKTIQVWTNKADSAPEIKGYEF